MSAEDPQTETPSADSSKRGDPGDVAHPLSAYISGTHTIYFDRGATVSRHMSQFDARAFMDQQQGHKTSDDLTWNTRHWFSWKSRRVVYSSFDADPDQNVSISPEHRRRLSAAGHGRGIADSLVRMWEGRDRSDEPSYSIRAMSALHWMALDGANRETWEAAARAFEGESGARRLAQTSVDHVGSRRGRPSVSDHHIDDTAEPDDAGQQYGPVTGGESVTDRPGAADVGVGDQEGDGGPPADGFSRPDSDHSDGDPSA